MEVAAGVIAVEQVVSTAVQGAAAAAGYGLAKKTLPLKATLSCFADDDLLRRSGHTASIVKNKLYLFGGKSNSNELASNEVQIVELPESKDDKTTFHPLPAVAETGDEVPSARTGHTAAVADGKIFVYGRENEHGVLSENGRVWVFDTESLKWTYLDTANERYPQLSNHAAGIHETRMIVHSSTAQGPSESLSDTWSFDIKSRVWTELPSLQEASKEEHSRRHTPPNAAVTDGRLYVISGSSNLGSNIYILDLSSESQSWSTVEFPTNPLTPGPKPRVGAGLVPVSTGWGRKYLLFMFGAVDTPSEGEHGDQPEGQGDFWSGLWSLQLPSVDKSAADLKDKANAKIGSKSREAEWAEVEIVLPDEPLAEQGKSHPGPRGYFASSAVKDERVVFWGGIDPSGEYIGDGWFVDLQV